MFYYYHHDKILSIFFLSNTNKMIVNASDPTVPTSACVFAFTKKAAKKKTFLHTIFVTPSIRDHLPRLEKQHRVKDVGSTNADNHLKKKSVAHNSSFMTTRYRRVEVSLRRLQEDKTDRQTDSGSTIS